MLLFPDHYPSEIVGQFLWWGGDIPSLPFSFQFIFTVSVSATYLSLSIQLKRSRQIFCFVSDRKEHIFYSKKIQKNCIVEFGRSRPKASFPSHLNYLVQTEPFPQIECQFKQDTHQRETHYRPPE